MNLRACIIIPSSFESVAIKTILRFNVFNRLIIWDPAPSTVGVDEGCP